MPNLHEILHDNGYSTVALPQSGIVPMQLLAKKNDHLHALGITIEDFFKPDSTGLPFVTNDATVADFLGATAMEITAGTGFNLLELLTKFGIGKAKAGVNFGANSQLVFSFENIKKDSIALGKLDAFLTGSVLQEGKFNTYEKRLKSSELFVISDVLKSNALSIEIRSKNQQQGEAELTLKDFIEFDANFKRESDNQVKIVHNTPESLVFAFKAARINYDKPGWFDRKDKPRFTIDESITRVILKGPEDLTPIWLPPSVVDFSKQEEE